MKNSRVNQCELKRYHRYVRCSTPTCTACTVDATRLDGSGHSFKRAALDDYFPGRHSVFEVGNGVLTRLSSGPVEPTNQRPAVSTIQSEASWLAVKRPTVSSIQSEASWLAVSYDGRSLGARQFFSSFTSSCPGV